MKQLLALLLLCSMAFLASCDMKPTPQDLFDKQKSGVVLICNKFYYELTLSSGQKIYFKGLDEGGDLEGVTTDLAEVKADPSVLTGTGFFVDGRGKILTNRHVVAPQVDKKMVRRSMNSILGHLALRIDEMQEEIEQKHQAIRMYIAESLEVDEYGGSGGLSQHELEALEHELAELTTQYEVAEAEKQIILNDLSRNYFEVRLHSRFGIVYDGERVNGWEDFMKKPCVLVRTAKEEETDLALLRLESNETPANKHVFELSLEEPAEDLVINQKLYMMGYNAGVTLAQTTEGISVQFTSGTVTQNPDANRVVYSIPTVQGSSGAPVVDEYGKVVAVNFAKLKGTDNFNFGVPMKRIRQFLQER